MTSNLELSALDILKKAERMGHTALPENRLIKLLCKETGQKTDTLTDALERSEVVTTRVTETDIIIRSSLKATMLETQVVEHIDRLISSFAKKQVRKPLSKNDISLGKSTLLSNEQLDAINASLSRGFSVITGGPGTGKTTMILGLVRAIKNLGLSVTLCAPTGKAAKRLGEATGLQKFRPATVHRYLQSIATNSAKDFDVMIVDEASMLDITLFHNLLSTIPDSSQIILIGDKDQLPPVAPGQPFKDIIQRVEGLSESRKSISPLLDDSISGIVSAAYSIITGLQPNSELNLENNNFEFIECDQQKISELTLEYYFNRIPTLLGKDFDTVKDEIQVLSPQRNGSAGVTRLNTEIQKKLTRKGTPLYESKKGMEFNLFARDRVIQTANAYDLGIMNGETGYIHSKTEEGLKVIFDEREIIYSEDQLENLQLAYALTIHKSQGSEYAGVIIPVSNEHIGMLSRNLLYTAVTRGKAKVCLIGEKHTFSRAIADSFKGSRYTGLKLELDKKSTSKNIALTRLTEIYRQKKL